MKKAKGKKPPKEEKLEINRDELGRLLPGQASINPAGRPKGARSRFGEVFVTDMLNDWQKHGAQAIKDVREKSPDAYLKAACAVLPKIIELDDDTKDILKEALTQSIQFDKIREKLGD